MRIAKVAFAAAAVGVGVVSFRVGTATGAGAPFWRAVAPRGSAEPVKPTPPPARTTAKTVSKVTNVAKRAAATLPVATAEGLLENYCRDCHNDQLQLGTQSFDSFTVAKAFGHREQAELMIKKLRTEMMPLPGVPRPPSDTLQALAATIEQSQLQSGVQHVKVTWRVDRPDGKEIGQVSQENNVPNQLLKTAWGEIANAVAQNAAGGIAALVEQADAQAAAR